MNSKSIFRFIRISIVYIALCTGSSFAQQSSTVELLAQLNHRPIFHYNDCWGYTAPDGREYALLGSTNGTSIIDITDVSNLHEIAFFQTINTTWKDIKTYKHYAYIVTDGQGTGMQIIDLSTLPDSARLVSTYRGNNFRLSHNIFIDEPNAMLYAIGEVGEWVRAISLADPENPVQVSAFGYECHDIYARDNKVYVAEGSRGSIAIYDLTSPQTPTLAGRFFIPSAGYAHNCWLSEDGNYLMTTEETYGKTVKYWDIRDLNDVKLVDNYLAPEMLAHNAHIKGRYAYISHYTDGLRILDLQDPSNIQEVGYYDTFPDFSFSLFAGAWGAFPFFDSGKILISDISTGLYIVRFTPTSTGIENTELPAEFALHPNYPNPFNPSTVIPFSLPQTAHTTLDIYTVAGQKIRRLIDAQYGAGQYKITWDGRDDFGWIAPAGMYFFRLQAQIESRVLTRIQKGLLVK